MVQQKLRDSGQGTGNHGNRGVAQRIGHSYGAQASLVAQDSFIE